MSETLAPAKTSLRILVVDDERANLLVLAAMLRKMGHSAVSALSGAQGIALFQEQTPDLVVSDVMMPEMSGYEMVREIRRLPGGQQIPIIFLSSLDQAEDVVEGLEAGGDDFLHKPVHYELLKSKVALLYERQWLFANQIRQNKVLVEYQARIQDDLNTAVRFADRLSALECIDDPAVRFFLRSAEDFGGDLVAAARTPDNVLHAMLADSAGHGLSAALSIFPVVEPFYRMTERGFDISAIVVELNSRARKYTSLPRYVAATLVALDAAGGHLTVWNGGMPDALLVAPGKGVLRRFASRNMPLGVLSNEKLDNSVEHCALGSEPSQLLICSDGVTELAERDAIDFDLEALLVQPQPLDFDALAKELARRLDGRQVSDDISLIRVDCTPPEAAVSVVGDGGGKLALLAAEGSTTWKIGMSFTAPQLRQVDVVPLLLGITGAMEAEGATLSAIFVVLSELFNNALDHGVLELDSRLKQDTEGMGAYYDERLAKLAALAEGWIKVGVERICAGDRKWIRIRVRDSGKGFDFSRFAAADGKPNVGRRHGRGLGLVAGMCDHVEFGTNGSEVVAYLGDP